MNIFPNLNDIFKEYCIFLSDTTSTPIYSRIKIKINIILPKKKEKLI